MELEGGTLPTNSAGAAWPRPIGRSHGSASSKPAPPRLQLPADNGDRRRAWPRPWGCPRRSPCIPSLPAARWRPSRRPWPSAAVHVACTQEAPLFREVAAEKGEADLAFTNIRERAGWCADKPAALPKMAALLAEAALTPRPTGVTTLKSDGVCLVYGRGQAALDVAAELSERLSVTVLLRPGGGLPPGIVAVPIYKAASARPPGISAPSRSRSTATRRCCPPPRARKVRHAAQRRRSTCDIIFDMSGGTPLFADAQRRDGYLRIDPSHQRAWRAPCSGSRISSASSRSRSMLGYDAGICAPPAARKSAAPTARQLPHRRHHLAATMLAIDAAICGGCGSYSAVCPTGAVSYALSPARRSGGAPGRAAQDLPKRRRHTPRGAVPRREAWLAAHRSDGAARQGAAGQRATAVMLSVLQLGHGRWPRHSPSRPEHIVVLAPTPSTPPSSPRWRARPR